MWLNLSLRAAPTKLVRAAYVTLRSEGSAGTMRLLNTIALAIGLASASVEPVCTALLLNGIGFPMLRRVLKLNLSLV